ncbi:hypothetical protein AX774_g7052 [Zancudomyces culisetae]|uniref:Uncharacterized protein n=1 Tax=Zancudomyces culisetae TaxID=1213189 RepID=A0A1R1PEZ5_ZANCU|nr:hypothetical protein AX774_g7052 [Zancudomyces culisetae]|eukprot:OMH79531.1 hypothetical protein AX774_g7052 [Zancudomyces culisetae]
MPLLFLNFIPILSSFPPPKSSSFSPHLSPLIYLRFALMYYQEAAHPILIHHTYILQVTNCQTFEISSSPLCSPTSQTFTIILICLNSKINILIIFVLPPLFVLQSQK